MQVDFMVTNGGPHPADKWADMTTETIMDLLVDANPDSTAPEALAARQAKRELRPKLFDLFNAHHGAVQDHEKGLTKKVKTLAQSGEHLMERLDPTEHTDATMTALSAILGATPFSAHFGKPEVLAVLRNIVGQHTADVMHIERRWHQDRLVAAKGA